MLVIESRKKWQKYFPWNISCLFIPIFFVRLTVRSFEIVNWDVLSNVRIIKLTKCGTQLLQVLYPSVHFCSSSNCQQVALTNHPVRIISIFIMTFYLSYLLYLEIHAWKTFLWDHQSYHHQQFHPEPLHSVGLPAVAILLSRLQKSSSVFFFSLYCQVSTFIRFIRLLPILPYQRIHLFLITLAEVKFFFPSVENC